MRTWFFLPFLFLSQFMVDFSCSMGSGLTKHNHDPEVLAEIVRKIKKLEKLLLSMTPEEKRLFYERALKMFKIKRQKPLQQVSTIDSNGQEVIPISATAAKEYEQVYMRELDEGHQEGSEERTTMLPLSVNISNNPSISSYQVTRHAIEKPNNINNVSGYGTDVENLTLQNGDDFLNLSSGGENGESTNISKWDVNKSIELTNASESRTKIPQIGQQSPDESSPDESGIDDGIRAYHISGGNELSHNEAINDKLSDSGRWNGSIMTSDDDDELIREYNDTNAHNFDIVTVSIHNSTEIQNNYSSLSTDDGIKDGIEPLEINTSIHEKDTNISLTVSDISASNLRNGEISYFESKYNYSYQNNSHLEQTLYDSSQEVNETAEIKDIQDYFHAHANIRSNKEKNSEIEEIDHTESSTNDTKYEINIFTKNQTKAPNIGESKENDLYKNAYDSQRIIRMLESSNGLNLTKDQFEWIGNIYNENETLAKIDLNEKDFGLTEHQIKDIAKEISENTPEMREMVVSVKRIRIKNKDNEERDAKEDENISSENLNDEDAEVVTVVEEDNNNDDASSEVSKDDNKAIKTSINVISKSQAEGKSEMSDGHKHTKDPKDNEKEDIIQIAKIQTTKQPLIKSITGPSVTISDIQLENLIAEAMSNQHEHIVFMQNEHESEIKPPKLQPSPMEEISSFEYPQNKREGNDLVGQNKDIQIDSSLTTSSDLTNMMNTFGNYFASMFDVSDTVTEPNVLSAGLSVEQQQIHSGSLNQNKNNINVFSLSEANAEKEIKELNEFIKDKKIEENEKERAEFLIDSLAKPTLPANIETKGNFFDTKENSVVLSDRIYEHLDFFEKEMDNKIIKGNKNNLNRENAREISPIHGIQFSKEINKSWYNKEDELDDSEQEHEIYYEEEKENPSKDWLQTQNAKTQEDPAELAVEVLHLIDELETDADEGDLNAHAVEPEKPAEQDSVYISENEDAFGIKRLQNDKKQNSYDVIVGDKKDVLLARSKNDRGVGKNYDFDSETGVDETDADIFDISDYETNDNYDFPLTSAESDIFSKIAGISERKNSDYFEDVDSKETHVNTIENRKENDKIESKDFKDDKDKDLIGKGSEAIPKRDIGINEEETFADDQDDFNIHNSEENDVTDVRNYETHIKIDGIEEKNDNDKMANEGNEKLRLNYADESSKEIQDDDNDTEQKLHESYMKDDKGFGKDSKRPYDSYERKDDTVSDNVMSVANEYTEGFEELYRESSYEYEDFGPNISGKYEDTSNSSVSSLLEAEEDLPNDSDEQHKDLTYRQKDMSVETSEEMFNSSSNSVEIESAEKLDSGIFLNKKENSSRSIIELGSEEEFSSGFDSFEDESEISNSTESNEKSNNFESFEDSNSTESNEAMSMIDESNEQNSMESKMIDSEEDYNSNSTESSEINTYEDSMENSNSTESSEEIFETSDELYDNSWEDKNSTESSDSSNSVESFSESWENSNASSEDTSDSIESLSDSWEDSKSTESSESYNESWENSNSTESSKDSSNSVESYSDSWEDSTESSESSNESWENSNSIESSEETEISNSVESYSDSWEDSNSNESSEETYSDISIEDSHNNSTSDESSEEFDSSMERSEESTNSTESNKSDRDENIKEKPIIYVEAKRGNFSGIRNYPVPKMLEYKHPPLLQPYPTPPLPAVPRLHDIPKLSVPSPPPPLIPTTLPFTTTSTAPPPSRTTPFNPTPKLISKRLFLSFTTTNYIPSVSPTTRSTSTTSQAPTTTVTTTHVPTTTQTPPTTTNPPQPPPTQITKFEIQNIIKVLKVIVKMKTVHHHHFHFIDRVHTVYRDKTTTPIPPTHSSYDKKSYDKKPKEDNSYDKKRKGYDKKPYNYDKTNSYDKKHNRKSSYDKLEHDFVRKAFIDTLSDSNDKISRRQHSYEVRKDGNGIHNYNREAHGLLRLRKQNYNIMNNGYDKRPSGYHSEMNDRRMTNILGDVISKGNRYRTSIRRNQNSMYTKKPYFTTEHDKSRNHKQIPQFTRKPYVERDYKSLHRPPDNSPYTRTPYSTSRDDPYIPRQNSLYTRRPSREEEHERNKLVETSGRGRFYEIPMSNYAKRLKQYSDHDTSYNNKNSEGRYESLLKQGTAYLHNRQLDKHRNKDRRYKDEDSHNKDKIFNELDKTVFDDLLRYKSKSRIAPKGEKLSNEDPETMYRKTYLSTYGKKRKRELDINYIKNKLQALLGKKVKDSEIRHLLESHLKRKGMQPE